MNKRSDAVEESAPFSASLAPRVVPTPAWAPPFWLGAACLVFVTLAAYAPVWHAGFVWDDDAHVTQNLELRRLSGLKRIWFHPRATPQYYPLVHTTFWVEYHLWGANPLGYHVVNVLLHAANSLMLWRVLRRLDVPGAFLAAALFAVHPVHVESVAWITERKNVLSTLCYLASALALLRFWPPEESDAQPASRWRYYVLALLLFAAALFSKTVACSLPAAFLLVRWWKQGRITRRDLLVSAPLFALGLAMALQTVLLEKEQVGARGAEWDLSYVERLLIAGRAVWFYAGKLVWPTPLIFIYPRWPINAENAWRYVFPLAALALLAALYALRGRLGRGPLVAALFFGGTLVPALGFFDVYPMRFSFVADHFQYLASVGLLAVVAAGLAGALSNRRPAVRCAGGAAFVVMFGFFAVLTWRRAEAYQDVFTLWTDTLDKNPECWMAYTNRADAYMHKGRLQEALADCTQSLEIEPDQAEAFGTRGQVYLRLGQAQHAIDDCTRAVELKPGQAEMYNNRGSVYAPLGHADEAILDFTQAIELKPEMAWAYFNRGNVYTLQGRLSQALADFDRAIELQPQWGDAYGSRGMIFLMQRRFYLAAEEFDRALELQPDSANVYFGRALLHFARQEYGAAWSDVKRGQELGGTPDPKFVRDLAKASGRSE